MLNPDERAHLFEMLRPPAGWRLDHAIGTTFSLDLLTLVTLPLSFALFDHESADGRPTANPLAMLEAVRRYGDRMTIFCQATQIRLPVHYPVLLPWLEESVFQVTPPNKRGVFHPKLWILRFIDQQEGVHYRLLCLTRNLTFDRCWDAAVILDGDVVDREKGIAANHPLADFVGQLPDLAKASIGARRPIIRTASEELRRVRFELPDGFEGYRFWHAGLDGTAASPFGNRKAESLVMAPFVSDDIINEFASWGEDVHLISRLETLQSLQPSTVDACRSAYYLQPEVQTEDAIERQPEPGEVLEGLHAKMFIIDRGWETSVFLGSFNATEHAFHHNIEFMVELIGRKSRFGVCQFLEQTSGETKFIDLLQLYVPPPNAPPVDKSEKRLDMLAHEVKRALVSADPRLLVTANDDSDSFNLTLEFRRKLVWPEEGIEARAWPISLRSAAALNLSANDSLKFERVSFSGLTSFIAFAVKLRVDGRERNTTFVMNLPLEGAPTDRRERVMAALLENQEQFLRYLLFLLAADDEDMITSSQVLDILTDTNPARSAERMFPALLETMLRALHRDPAQIQRVASVLEQLRRAPSGSELLSEDFQQIWNPIWEATQAYLPK